MSETVIFPSGTADNIAEGVLKSLTLRQVRAQRAVLVNPLPHSAWYSQPSPILSYASEGDSQSFLNYAKRPLRVKEGQCQYIPAGMMRRSIRAVDGARLIREFSLFELRIFGTIPLLPFFNIPLLFPAPKAIVILPFLQALISQEKGDMPERTFTATICGYRMMFNLLHILLDGATPTPLWGRFLTHQARLHPTLEYMRSHQAEPLGIQDLCEVAAMSPSTLTRAFRASFNITPLHYLRKMRLERAQHLVLTSDDPLEQIAQRVGYGDVFAFSKAFRRQFATSPSHYRTAGHTLI